MPDDKNRLWSAAHEKDADQPGHQTAGGDGESGPGDESWDAYRKWLRRGSESKRSRGALDPSLYTWKGYRNWAEQVKRNWSDRHQTDTDES